MRIEIEEKAPGIAAPILRKEMERRGGSWLVNAVGGEGYVAARVGTLEGKRLSRSGAVGLCGPFDITTDQDYIEAAMLTARLLYIETYDEDEETEGDQRMVA